MRLLIELDPGEPRRGLAIDELLLDRARGDGGDAVRLWVNDWAVVVGRSQSVVDEVDVAFAAQAGIPVLRRISGGGTVCHYPGNLNVSIVLREGGRLGSVGEVFRLFGATIATSLSGLCPAISCEANDLRIGAAKVGGAAQARRGDALLYHTTLLVRPSERPIERLLLAMRAGYRPRRVPSRPRPMLSLREAVGGDISVEALSEVLVGALSTALSRPLERCRLSPGEEERPPDGS